MRTVAIIFQKGRKGGPVAFYQKKLVLPCPGFEPRLGWVYEVELRPGRGNWLSAFPHRAAAWCSKGSPARHPLARFADGVVYFDERHAARTQDAPAVLYCWTENPLRQLRARITELCSRLGITKEQAYSRSYWAARPVYGEHETLCHLAMADLCYQEWYPDEAA